MSSKRELRQLWRSYKQWRRRWVEPLFFHRPAEPSPEPKAPVHFLDLAPAMLAAVDMDRWHEAEARWRQQGGHDFHTVYAKYFDLPHWLPGSLIVARDLDLIGGTPRRVLDIGCGPGILGHVVQQLGHGYLGLDIGNPMFLAMCSALDVPCVTCRVAPMTPLPDELGRFDIISAINTKFHLDEKIDGELRKFDWQGEHWRFFLADCRRRLNPGGAVYLKLNRLDDIAPSGRVWLDRGRWLQPRTVLIGREALPEHVPAELAPA